MTAPVRKVGDSSKRHNLAIPRPRTTLWELWSGPSKRSDMATAVRLLNSPCSGERTQHGSHHLARQNREQQDHLIRKLNLSRDEPRLNAEVPVDGPFTSAAHRAGALPLRR